METYLLGFGIQGFAVHRRPSAVVCLDGAGFLLLYGGGKKLSRLSLDQYH